MSKPDGWIFPLPMNLLVETGDTLTIPGYSLQLIKRIDTSENVMFTVDAPGGHYE